MKNYVLTIAIGCLMLAGCAKQEKRPKYDLRGAWIMTQVAHNIGCVHSYPNGEGTLCRIYENDSVYYECRINTMKPDRPQNIMTASDVTIVPIGRTGYTLIEKNGEGKPRYLENRSVHPIEFPNDTTMIIQSYGHKYTWVLAQGMEQSRVEEIKSIIANNLDTNGEAPKFALSTTERQLKATTHTLAHIIIILVLAVLLIVHIAINIYRKKQYIEQQLRQIREEHEQRPQPVRQAMAEVEEQFLRSDFYLSLRRRITAGETLKKEAWNEVEQQLRPVWPGFTNRLLGLCQMSELEYRVCLLIKLRVPPSEMANLLSKETSTISTIRSRLYQKVFQRKGSSKEWDKFILSL